MNMIPHRYDIEMSIDSEITTDTKLYFCAGCGRARSPKMKDIKFDTPCVAKPKAEVQERVRSRMELLAAMIQGGHEYYHTKPHKRRSRDSNPAPRKD